LFEIRKKITLKSGKKSITLRKIYILSTNFQIKIKCYNCNPVSMSLYTTFEVCPLSVSFSNTLILFADVHLESPTYNCPWEKTGDLKSNPTCAKDCPWLLFTVITNASQSGIGKSSADGASVILGINTVFPANLLSAVMILHLSTLCLMSVGLWLPMWHWA